MYWQRFKSYDQGSFLRINKSEFDAIKKEGTDIAHLVPWSDQENFMWKFLVYYCKTINGWNVKFSGYFWKHVSNHLSVLFLFA